MTADSPTNPREPGSFAIARWLDEAGLSRVTDLLPTLCEAAPDMDALTALNQEALVAVIAPLKLKPQSMKYKKLMEAFAQLRGEAGNPTCVQDLIIQQPRRRRSSKPTTVGLVFNELPHSDAPLLASAPSLKLTRPYGFGPEQLTTEADELSDLAVLLMSGGQRDSKRPESGKAASRAAEAAAEAASQTQSAAEGSKRSAPAALSPVPFSFANDHATGGLMEDASSTISAEEAAPNKDGGGGESKGRKKKGRRKKGAGDSSRGSGSNILKPTRVTPTWTQQMMVSLPPPKSPLVHMKSAQRANAGKENCSPNNSRAGSGRTRASTSKAATHTPLNSTIGIAGGSSVSPPGSFRNSSRRVTFANVC